MNKAIVSNTFILKVSRATFAGLCLLALTGQAVAGPSYTPPFVQNGTSVTTPGASGTYNSSYFSNNGTGFTVQITGSTTLNNTNSIVLVGDGSSISVGSGVTINETAGGNAALLIQGGGSITNNGLVTSTSFNAMEIDGVGTITSNGAVSGHNFGIYIGNDGTVTNTSTITGVGNTALVINGNGTLNSSGAITGENFGVYIGGNGTVSNSSTITGQGNTALFINGTGTVTSSGAITGQNFGILINGNATVTNTSTITGQNNTAIQIGSGNITSSGAILGYNFGILDNGSGTIINSAAVTGTHNTAIQLGSGTVNNSGVVTGYDYGVRIAGPGTLINSSTITGQNNTAVEIDGTGTINNSGIVSGNNNGLVVFGLGTITNSGTVTANNDGVYASTSGSSLTMNGGSITAGNNGAEFGGSATVNMTAGSITGNGNDGILFDSGGATLNMAAGSSVYGRNDGVLIQGNGTAVVGGSIKAHTNVGLWYFGTGNTTVLSTGNITGVWNGLQTDGAGSLTNSGVITGLGNVGAYFGGTGTVNLYGGAISGPGAAIVTNSAASSVSVVGRASLTNGSGGSGLIYNNSGTGTINLTLVGMTPAQVAAFNAQLGNTSGDVFAGGNEYKWQNYTLSGSAVSLETVADSGLTDIATKIDNQGLPLGFDAFYVAAAGNPEAALNTLTGREFDDAVGTIAVNNATTLSDIFDSRAFDLRTGTGGFDLSGLNINSGSLIASLGQTQDILGKMMGSSLLGGTTMSDSKEAITTESPEANRWGAWASGTITFADESSTATGPGFSSTTGSPTIGADYRVSNHLALGVLANYSTTGANFGDGSRLGVQTGLGALYGTWSDGPWYINGLAGGGYSSYDNQRVTFGGATANSSPDGNEVLANITGGYDFKLGGNWVVSPEAGLLYTHVTENAFTESGAGVFDLSQADQDIDSLRTKLGFHVLNNFKWDGIKFTPQFRAAWYHECLDDSRGVSSSFAGAPALGSFVVQTNSQGRDFAIVGAGLSATPSELHDNITFFVNYDAQVGQDNYLSHTVNGGLRIGF